MLFQSSQVLNQVIQKYDLPGLLNMESSGFSDSRIFLFIYSLTLFILFKVNNTQTAKKLKERLPNDLETSEDPTLHKASPSPDTLAKSVKNLSLKNLSFMFWVCGLDKQVNIFVQYF